MDRQDSLERYLHRQIPLSAAMEISVLAATTETVRLSAPLEPNINHKSTAFGGSLSTLGILAAWSLLHVRLTDAGFSSEIVIQSSHMDYDKPVNGPFIAESSLAAAATWPLFLKTLNRRRLARIEVHSNLICEGIVAGRFAGKFVAFLQDGT